MKKLTYLFFVLLFFNSCKCREDPVDCVNLDSDELMFMETMSGASLNFVDAKNRLLTLEFQNIESSTDQDEYASKMDDCRMECKRSGILRGAFSGFYGGVRFDVGLTYTTNNKTDDIEKVFKIIIGKEEFQSTRFPFYKHNRASYYKVLEVGNREYKKVYKVPISSTEPKDSNLVFYIKEVFLTEEDGIVGISNRLDSLHFFRVY